MTRPYFDYLKGKWIDGYKPKGLEFSNLMDQLNDMDNVDKNNTELLQAVLQGEFDEAALQTDFQQKLEAAESTYAPRLTTLENEVVEINEQFEDVAIISPKRQSGESDDNAAISRAINQIQALGGGIIRWSGTLLISQPIEIDSDRVQLSALGEVSKIRAIAEMDYMIRIQNSTSIYGRRGLAWENLYLDCNNLAKEGLRLGGTYPVVQSTFSNIVIRNALQYGLVLDAVQNSLFLMLDIEQCGGCVKLLNGAGNNFFLKCEFADANGLNHIYLGRDSNYPGYALNIFNRDPQFNNFMGCITERGTREANIWIEYGRDNSFERHESSSSGTMNSCAFYLGDNSALNKFSGRFAHASKTNPVVINRGYRNQISNSYVESLTGTYFAQTTNKLILLDVKRDTGDILIQNLAGDNAENILTDVRYVGSNITPTTNNLLPGQFGYSSEKLFFRGKNNVVVLQTGNELSGFVNSTTKTLHTITFTLPESGTWIIDMYARNGDGNHSISNTFNARFKDNEVNDLKDIQKTINDVVVGTIITSLNASIDEKGEVTITAIANTNTPMVFDYQCKQINSY